MARRDDGLDKPIEHTQTMTTGFEEVSSGAQRRLVVRVVDGPDRGRFVALGDATVLVGAGESADLPLRDPGVSRRHLEIAVVTGGVRVVDLQSKNGTLLQGARLSQALVGVGAELVLGRTTLRIDDADALLDVAEADALGPLSTKSTSMRRLFGALARVAPTDIAILLEGEADTGKPGVARALHDASNRAGKPFAAISMAAQAAGGEARATALSIALFGKGDVPGAFEQANGGTLFLDDVDATPAALQEPLARALITGTTVRVADASGRVRRASPRVIAATTRDLDADVRAGRLLAELRDAVGAVRVVVPALRDRSADLPALCAALLDELGAGGCVVDDAGLARLRAHRFAGNLAELKQVLARAIASTPAGQPLQIAIDAAAAQSGAASMRDERDKFEREKLVELLKAHDGNVSAAARAAGYDRRHLHRLMKKHGIRT